MEELKTNTDKDITSEVRFGGNDDECLSLERCTCGQEFESWDFILGIYREWANECPKCHRKLYFANEIRVYEAKDE